MIGMWSHVFCLFTPEPDKTTKNAIQKLYRTLDTLAGYAQLPMLCRHDFQFLKKWTAKYHPTNRKAQLILNYLT